MLKGKENLQTYWLKGLKKRRSANGSDDAQIDGKPDQAKRQQTDNQIDSQPINQTINSTNNNEIGAVGLKVVGN